MLSACTGLSDSAFQRFSVPLINTAYFSPRRHENTKNSPMTLIDADPFSRRVIGCAIEVHRTLGPGPLESIYETCLCIELDREGLAFERQPPLAVTYKGLVLDLNLRPDLIVEQALLVEVKSVQSVLP